MKTFDELWNDILERCERFQFPLVQDKEEIRHVFNLIQGAESYLEVGCAEGNSLHVLGQNILRIAVIDYGEAHTQIPRSEVIKETGATEILGNSHATNIINVVCNKYDVVLIDAGHTYEDVIADAIAYGHLATKCIFFHDIQLPPVKAAFDWYCKQNPQFKVSTFINSETFGYGIIEV